MAELDLLLEHPKLETNPGLKEALVELRLKAKPPRERFEEYLAQGFYLAAIDVTSLLEDPDLAGCKVSDALDEAWEKDREPILKMIKELVLAEQFCKISDYLSGKISESKELVELLAISKQIAVFKQMQSDLEDNAGRLWKNGTVELAKYCLIALSRRSQYTFSMNTNLRGYDHYLGSGKYEAYLVDNVYGDTTKVHKAASHSHAGGPSKIQQFGGTSRTHRVDPLPPRLRKIG